MAWYNDPINTFMNGLAIRIAGYINDARSYSNSILANYYTGDHRPQLKTTPGKQDDNIIQNFTGLAVDRSVSRLYRGGVKFQLPEGNTDQQEYIDKVWDLNKKEILMCQEGLHGGVYGTWYLKICPDELIDPYTEKLYPRLIALDPEIVRIKTHPQDMSEVTEYRIEYSVKIGEGAAVKQINYREITRRKQIEVDYEAADETADIQNTWVVEYWEQSGMSAAWVLTDTVAWDYTFPPILHCKNLPSLKSCYGDSDIDDAVNIQDKSNFVVSNTAKIVKFYASPQTVGTGFSKMDTIDGAVGSFHTIANPDAKVYNLEMDSDLASSRALSLDLRQSIFDIAREIDLSSIADKLGGLTNFGLRVLYTDAMDKNDTKRQLYGDAFKEINRRLLVLAGWVKEESDPGTAQWGDPLPTNIVEDLTADGMAIDMGIVDKETVATRYEIRYGANWKIIQERLAKQKQSEPKPPPLTPLPDENESAEPLAQNES